MKAKNIGNKLIIQELERISARNGGILKPEDIVNDARNPKSPLHKRFDWNNTKAAYEWRLLQARNLIRVVVQIIPNGTSEPSRVWVSLMQDQNKKGGGYRPLISVLSNEELRRQLLEEALRDMECFSQKYYHLNELATLFSAIKKVKKKLK